MIDKVMCARAFTTTTRPGSQASHTKPALFVAARAVVVVVVVVLSFICGGRRANREELQRERSHCLPKEFSYVRMYVG